MKKECLCRQEAFRIEDASNGFILYTCKKTPDTLTDKNFKKIVKNTQQPCNFKLKIQLYEKIKPVKKEIITHIKKQQTCPYENLYNKVETFIKTKLYIYFQEIEIELKKLKIPLYDHLSETMYQFCIRIQKICKQKFSFKQATQVL